VLLYPSLCFFEGTPVSVGRGTDKQFQVIGHPDYPDKDFSFTPRSLPGAMNPPLKDELCFGIDLSSLNVDSLYGKARLDLSYLIHMYNTLQRSSFFNTNWFDKLAGGPGLRQSIEAGWSEEQIRESWNEALQRFEQKRIKYLLYP
jgi:uncharacterized protein YbbC (DUF1343 family)